MWLGSVLCGAGRASCPVVTEDGLAPAQAPPCTGVNAPSSGGAGSWCRAGPACTTSSESPRGPGSLSSGAQSIWDRPQLCLVFATKPGAIASTSLPQFPHLKRRIRLALSLRGCRGHSMRQRTASARQSPGPGQELNAGTALGCAAVLISSHPRGQCQAHSGCE